MVFYGNTYRSKLWKIMSRLMLRMVFSGMLRRVTLARTDVSEEPRASFIKVTRISESNTNLTSSLLKLQMWSHIYLCWALHHAYTICKLNLMFINRAVRFKVSLHPPFPSLRIMGTCSFLSPEFYCPRDATAGYAPMYRARWDLLCDLGDLYGNKLY
jgi:hypothetical protein